MLRYATNDDFVDSAVDALPDRAVESFSKVLEFQKESPAALLNRAISYLQSKKLDAAKKFQAFYASPEGCDAISEATAPTGPYAVKTCKLPADVPQAVKDMQPYFDNGANSPALEFLSPVKGPALEQITVEVGSGIRQAADGAALYDQDVKKQAQQLGLEGW